MALSPLGPIWTTDHMFFPNLDHGLNRKGRPVSTTADAHFQIRRIDEPDREDGSRVYLFIVYRDDNPLPLGETFERLDEAKAFVASIYETENEG